MRRRSVLAAWGSCLAAIAGCAGDRNPANQSTSSDAAESTTSDTDSAESTPSNSNPREAFRAAVDQHATRVEAISLEGTDWTVRYHAEECCGDSFRAHQATLARNFSSVRPTDVSLTMTTFHECMTIRWRIPAHLARKHRAGDITTTTYVNRVQNTTSRESQC